MRYPKLITDAHVRSAARQGQTELVVGPNTIVTPLARDAARDLNVVLAVSRETNDVCGCEHGSDLSVHRTTAPFRPSLAIGSDHGGFDVKSEIKGMLTDLGRDVVDVGTDSTESCDYPDFAYAVALLVASGKAALGIMIDGAGPGSAIACNKVPGIRAACVHDEFTAWNARAHNDANVITFGSRGIGIEIAKRLVRVFLETEFEGGRHENRVRKITDVERRFLGGGKEWHRKES